jgi:hypothetical protein
MCLIYELVSATRVGAVPQLRQGGGKRGNVLCEYGNFMVVSIATKFGLPSPLAGFVLRLLPVFDRSKRRIVTAPKG